MKLLGVLVLAVGLVGAAAPSLTPMPWRYGVVFWVGEVPPQAPTYLTLAQNWVERVFSFWGLTPVPSPAGWGTLQEVRAQTAQEARALLGEGFPAQGLVVPGPKPETFWAIPPLRFRDRELQPLTLVVFPSDEALEESLGVYGVSGVFIPPGERWRKPLALADPWIWQLIQSVPGPILLVPWEGLPPLSPRDYFLLALSHEMAHWATLVWAEEQGLDFHTLPLLLIEGLAEYTRRGSVVPPHIPPFQVYFLAAAWAREGGLRDLPPRSTVLYDVGASLVDFLSRKYSWASLLNRLPAWLAAWEEHLARWEEEWRAWLAGELSPEARRLYAVAQQELLTCVRLVLPLFPKAWDLALDILAGRREIQAFGDLLEGPLPPPTPELWEKLARRARLFGYLAQDLYGAEGKRALASQVWAELSKLREQGAWEEYARRFLEGVRTLIAGIPARQTVP
ncbi:MAG: hypothetical protein N2507_02275 [Candidatus Bipolaricaulota bacterium]|nr:hypothetical protein [Candidatus Bipolaricaulota bacterium]